VRALPGRLPRSYLHVYPEPFFYPPTTHPLLGVLHTARAPTRPLPSSPAPPQHPSIIQLAMHLETPKYVVMAFELMNGGDLYKYLTARGSAAADMALTESQARRVFTQVRPLSKPNLAPCLILSRPLSKPCLAPI